MKSANNGGILNGSLQVLHVNVLLVASLGTSYMAESGTDQHEHEGRVAVREAAHHTGAAADLPVQPSNHIIGADARPVFTGKVSVSQRFLDAVLHLLGGLFQFHRAQLHHHSLSLFTGSFLALLSVDRLEHFSYQFSFRARFD